MGERACRFWACFARRGLFWACFSPATDDENCDAPEGAPHEVSRGAYAGEDVWRACVGCTCMAERRDHAAQGRAEQVGPAQGKWHRAGSPCINITGQACSAGQACAQVRLVCSVDRVTFAAYGRAPGWQQVKREGSFVWRGNGGTRGRHSTVGTTRSSSCCTRLWG